MRADVVRKKVLEDYVSGLSYREIAERYDLGIGTISRWAKEGGWDVKRIRQTYPTAAQIMPHRTKTERVEQNGTNGTEGSGDGGGAPDGIAETAEDFGLLREAARKILANINALLDLDEPLAPRDLKALSGTLLDLKNQLGALSPRELREQQARLRQLEKSLAEETKTEQGVVIRFEDTEGAEI